MPTMPPLTECWIDIDDKFLIVCWLYIYEGITKFVTAKHLLSTGKRFGWFEQRYEVA